MPPWKTLLRVTVPWLAFLALVWGVWLLSGHLRVQSRVKAIRERGEPVTLAELQRWYEAPPPDEDAGPAYLAAIEAYAAVPPLAPCTGQALRYRRLDRGYVVYSVGHDDEDDGGVDIHDREGDNLWLTLDYAVSVPR